MEPFRVRIRSASSRYFPGKDGMIWHVTVGSHISHASETQWISSSYMSMMIGSGSGGNFFVRVLA